MPKQKYYYAVVDKKSGKIVEYLIGAFFIFRNKTKAEFYCHPEVEKIVPIPADSLHKLLTKHKKK